MGDEKKHGNGSRSKSRRARREMVSDGKRRKDAGTKQVRRNLRGGGVREVALHPPGSEVKIHTLPEACATKQDLGLASLLWV